MVFPRHSQRFVDYRYPNWVRVQLPPCRVSIDDDAKLMTAMMTVIFSHFWLLLPVGPFKCIGEKNTSANTRWEENQFIHTDRRRRLPEEINGTMWRGKFYRIHQQTASTLHYRDSTIYYESFVITSNIASVWFYAWLIIHLPSHLQLTSSGNRFSSAPTFE